MANSAQSVTLASDDNVWMKKIQATHGPENHEINVKPLLQMIEVILELAARAPGEFKEPHVHVEPLSNENLGDMREHLAHMINSISNEILENCSGEQDVQETMFKAFNAVSNFSWDAKGVIVLAAFAVNYGEFSLVAQLRSVDKTARSIALLQQIPQVDKSEFSDLRLAMSNLTRALLELIKFICDFKNLKSEQKYIEPDAPEILLAEAQIPTALYWTIRSIVICQLQITKLTGTGNEYVASADDAWQLSKLAHRIIQLHDQLKQQLHLCNLCAVKRFDKVRSGCMGAEENRVKEVYKKLVNLFEATHEDNTEILKALVGSQYDALDNGHKNRPESINSLGRKKLLLYISGLKLSHAEVSVLMNMYNKKETDEDYDIVWLPVVEKSSPWNEKNQKLFEDARDTMPWISLGHPSLLDTAVIEYIKNVWNFENRSVILALNSKGKIVHYNALYMIMIWGSKAFPFSSTKEEQLLAAESWRLELLVDLIEPPIAKWIAEGRFVCLYGGEDIEWIKEFTTIAQSAFQNAEIHIDMVYMGTGNQKDKVEKINAITLKENIGHRVANINQMWLFWFRLQCIWHLGVQRGKPPETDDILQEVLMFRSFECSGRGWAIINKSDQMAKAMGDTMLQCLSKFDHWKSQAEEKGFVTALNEQIHQTHTLKGCNKLELPTTTTTTTTGIPKRIPCFECKRVMEESTTFRCCGDESAYW